MRLTWDEIIVWLIVGALAGALVGLVVTRKKEGFGRWANLGIGLVGAMIGGLIFDLFNINLGLETLKVSLEDLLAAFLGALILLGGFWVVRKWRRAKSPGPSAGPNP